MTESQKTILVSEGINLTDALERFMDNETLYENFLRKFTTNPNFTQLKDSLLQKDYENALAISHNLKGVSGSLGFTHLYDLLCTQVTMLRQNENSSAAALMDEILSEYQRLLTVANQVLS